MIRIAAAAAALLLAPLTAAAQGDARAPLKEFAPVTAGLITIGMAHEIASRCDSITARRLRGIFQLNGLVVAARRAGYSDAEVEAYVETRPRKLAWSPWPGPDLPRVAWFPTRSTPTASLAAASSHKPRKSFAS